MEKYKIGDKVICPIKPKDPEEEGGPGWNYAMDDSIGKVGTIEEVCRDLEKTRYFVRFDESCESWFYLEKWLIPAKEALKIEESKYSSYHIWTDNIKFVSASDDETGLIASARCHPNDSFDVVTGIEIAMDRLMDKIENRFYTGEVFCVKADEVAFSKGYIYHINKGVLYDDDGHIYCNSITGPELLAFGALIMMPVEGTKN